LANNKVGTIANSSKIKFVVFFPAENFVANEISDSAEAFQAKALTSCSCKPL
jgi:hypothetical protein